MKTTWSVVILHEDDATRAEAVEFCDRLVQRFWSSHEFDFSWWPFSKLRAGPDASEAASKAAQADMVVLATQPAAELPEWLQSWIEGWIRERGDREGALVALGDPGFARVRGLADKFVFLRSAAHHGGMDFLTRMPEEMARSIPDSLDSYSERASQITHVLAEILQRPSPRPARQQF
ncbi:MAG TPA: hypothetical protein VHH88_06130 [Verrucomicrobiae bacterium]|nr:hypothetical protein [Verrucomicrobiae bacterium]